jgi:UDP-N-acetylmuramoylalanine--D-glutamate ligase
MSWDVMVIGSGESGTGAALLAHKLGMNVCVCDSGKIKPVYKTALEEADISLRENCPLPDDLKAVKEIIKSPGVPETAAVIQAALSLSIPILSEIHFAARHCSSTITAITGTNGKTTVTHWTYHLMKKAGMNVRIAGNMGKSWAMDLYEQEQMPEHYVLELSSFQLEDVGPLAPKVAILTNLSPDHLDRYNNDPMAYYQTKLNIAKNQTASDCFIWNADDPISEKVIGASTLKSKLLSIRQKEANGAVAYCKDAVLIIERNKETFSMQIAELALKGKHNLYNGMAAAVAARVHEIRNDVIREALSDFENIEHRLEKVLKIKGMDFINDSKATNVNATWYALECMEGPVIWIAGGVDKGNDYSSIVPLVKQKVKILICLGTDNSKLLEAFAPHIDKIIETQHMGEAVKAAYFMGEKGDHVLLSPACASFDLFENYEDRGRQFKKAVKAL